MAAMPHMRPHLYDLRGEEKTEFVDSEAFAVLFPQCVLATGKIFSQVFEK